MNNSEAVEKGIWESLPSLLFQVSAFFIGLKSETEILQSFFQLINDLPPHLLLLPSM
jgi:hypothetical protein